MNEAAQRPHFFMSTSTPVPLLRQVEADSQPALGRVLERKFATMAAGHVAGDGEAKADAARGRIARGIEAIERPEHGLALQRRNAGPVIIYQYIDPIPLGQ